jgi:hypothetical protein
MVRFLPWRNCPEWNVQILALARLHNDNELADNDIELAEIEEQNNESNSVIYRL